MPNHNADGTKVMALMISRETNEMPTQMKQNVRNLFKLGNSLMLRCVAFDFMGDFRSRLTQSAATPGGARLENRKAASRRWLARLVGRG